MTATIHQLRQRPMTEAERYVLALAEASDHIGKEKMMRALFESVLLLKEIAQLDRNR